MGLRFDGSGHVAFGARWVPTNPASFEFEVEFNIPSNQGYQVYHALIGASDRKGMLAVTDGKYYFGYESAGAAFSFAYLTTPVSYGQTLKIRARILSSTSVEFYFNDEVSPSETLTLGTGLVHFKPDSIGFRSEAIPWLLPDGAVVESVKFTDLNTASNSSIYLLDEGTGTAINDTGALGNDGTMTGFADLNAAWGIQGPSVTASGNLTPGGSFTLNYSDYDAIPVSPVTLTDSAGNSITVPVTISDSVNGTTGKHEGTATGTMPALPSSGSIAGLKFGTVNVSLSSA